MSRRTTALAIARREASPRATEDDIEAEADFLASEPDDEDDDAQHEDDES